MADNLNVTAGDGTGIVGADLIGGVLYQRVKLIQGVDGTNDGDVAASAPLQVTLANGTVPTHAVTQSGTWTVQPGNTANTTAWKVDASSVAVPITDNSGSLTVDNGGTFAVQATLAAGATNIAKAEDVLSADADVGVPAMAVQKATPANTAGTDGDYEFLQISAGKLWVKHVGNFVTARTQVTRPADTTQYTANDILSDSTSAPTSGGFTLSNMGRISGGSGIITDMLFGMSTAAGTSLQGELWLFDQAVTNVNDNSAFSISDGDRDNLVAIVPFTTSSSGSLNASAHVTGLNIGYTCSGTANLRFLVKVINAYTPASAEVFTVRVKALQID